MRRHVIFEVCFSMLIRGRASQPSCQLRFRMLFAAAAALLSTLAATLASPATAAHALTHEQLAASGFVTTAGGQLYLNGSPWRFTGYDAYQATSTRPGYECGGAYHQDQLDSLFAQMAQNSGSTVVRTWFFQSYGGPANWAQYDRVLNTAAAHGIRIIPALVNQWRQCEPLPSGMQQYRNLQWYQNGYRQVDAGYALSFRDFAVAMARHYANNPTIAFWQLVNEAEAMNVRHGACDNTAAAQALRAFADDVGGAVKAADPNHLVNLGTIGTGQCGIQESSYQYVNQSPGLDICEIHDYTNQAVPGGRYDGAAPDYAYCLGMNKPIFDGEVGIDASVRPDWSVSGTVTPATLATRASFFDQKASALWQMGGSGFLIWSKSLAPSSTWDVGPGDPTEAVMLAQALQAQTMLPGQSVTKADPFKAMSPRAIHSTPAGGRLQNNGVAGGQASAARARRAGSAANATPTDAAVEAVGQGLQR